MPSSRDTYLARCRHSDCSWPVVVHVRHAIRDLLNVVNLEAGRVGNNNVVSRRNSALPHVLADEEEILPNKHNRFANQLTICVGAGHTVHTTHHAG